MSTSNEFIVEPIAGTYVKDQNGDTVFKVTVYCQSTLAVKPLALEGRAFAPGSWLIETDTSKVYILDKTVGWREFN